MDFYINQYVERLYQFVFLKNIIAPASVVQ